MKFKYGEFVKVTANFFDAKSFYKGFTGRVVDYRYFGSISIDREEFLVKDVDREVWFDEKHLESNIKGKTYE